MAYTDVTITQQADRRASTMKAALSAILFGLLLVLGAGFAGAAAIHNAAHDGRHAFSFPCH